MPRHGRSVAAGFPMHVIQRSIDQTATVFGEGDDRVLSNPVRVRLVRAPEDDPWSSDRCNASVAADNAFVPHPL
jgi:hypothetical protein